MGEELFLDHGDIREQVEVRDICSCLLEGYLRFQRETLHLLCFPYIGLFNPDLVEPKS